MGEKLVFSANDAEKKLCLYIHTHTYVYICKTKQTKRENCNSHFTLYMKISLKMIIDPNIKPKSIQLLLEHVGENLCDIGLSDISSYDAKSIKEEK